MWRIIQGIGRGLRVIRPSQCCPQDCSEETPYCHPYNGTLQVHKAILGGYSTISTWSPATVTRYDHYFRRVACGVRQSRDINTTSCDNGGEGPNKSCYHQRCPPWHWDVLRERSLLEKCESEEQEEKEDQQSKEHWGNTWQYQEWKEILQASPTLNTLGLGSATALTLSLYRNWKEHSVCPCRTKTEQQETPDEATKTYNLKYNYFKEFCPNTEGLFEHQCRALKKFFQFNSPNISDTLSEDCSKVTNKDLKNTRTVVVQEQNEIEKEPHLHTAETKLHGPTVLLKFFLQKSLDLATVFNIQGNDEKENHIEKICEDEATLSDEIESLQDFQSDKSDGSGNTDSGCSMPDLNQSSPSQNTTDSETIDDQYKDNSQIDDCETVHFISTTESHGSADTKNQRAKAEIRGHSEDSKEHKEPSSSCGDETKVEILYERLLEIVKADREEQLQEVLRKDGNTVSNTTPEEAVVHYQAGVMAGDPSSAFNLALCYYMGHGITQDLEKARILYEASAAAGHGWAMYNLAVMLNQGLGGPCMPHRVRRLLRQAAKMGITEAAEALSLLKKKKEPGVICKEKPCLQKCCSEATFHSSRTNLGSFSHSADDLQFLLEKDVLGRSDLPTDVICNK